MCYPLPDSRQEWISWHDWKSSWFIQCQGFNFMPKLLNIFWLRYRIFLNSLCWNRIGRYFVRESAGNLDWTKLGQWLDNWLDNGWTMVGQELALYTVSHPPLVYCKKVSFQATQASLCLKKGVISFQSQFTSWARVLDPNGLDRE